MREFTTSLPFALLLWSKVWIGWQIVPINCKWRRRHSNLRAQKKFFTNNDWARKVQIQITQSALRVYSFEMNSSSVWESCGSSRSAQLFLDLMRVYVEVYHAEWSALAFTPGANKSRSTCDGDINYTTRSKKWEGSTADESPFSQCK